VMKAMTPSTTSLLLVFMLTLVYALPTSSQQAANQVTLLIPAFEGPDALGLNVATVLNLKLFATLRKAPWPNPKKSSFGDGLIVWDSTPLGEPSHETALQAARSSGYPTQLVLWGKAAQYADGVFVQAYLTIRDLDDGQRTRPEVWQLRFPDLSREMILDADIPGRRYSFEPIVLDNETVKLYSSPRALKIYRDKTLRDEIGTLSGGYFKATEHGPDGEWLEQPMRGWVPLPKLSEQSGETVEFVGGVLRMFRSDWDGATDLLHKVLKRPSTPTAVRIDSLLYLGLAAEKQQRSGRKEIEQAYALNPLSQTSATYLIMNAFADYLRAPPAERVAAIDRVGALLEQNRYLFATDHAWLIAADSVYQRIKHGD
jgi:hypothetical protein